MALTRRACLIALPACAGVLASCSSASRRAEAPLPATNSLSPVGSGKRGTIVVFMPETSQTKEVWTSLVDELKADFKLIPELETRAGVMARAIEEHEPVALVLMNNPTVSAYRDYQRSHAGSAFPPAVIVMTSFLDVARRQILNATGISYEVPLITAAINLRKMTEGSVDRLGVVRRDALAGFVERQADLAKREKFVVFEQKVSNSPNPSELKRALRLLKEHVDALWILNDDRLLTPQLIADGWVPGLNERPRIPSLVGAGSLVSSQSSFGTFAVLPDHTALGAQAAGLIYDIADDDWTAPSDAESAPPLSVITILDIKQARERLQLRPDAVKHVDRVLE